MSNIFNATQATYHHYFYELADRRTDDWLFMGSPWHCVAIVAIYIYFLEIAPKYMKDRPAFKLDKIICLYNFMQLFSCLYIVINGFGAGWKYKYKLFCEPVNYSNTPEAIEVAEIGWYYLLLKIMDLLDTVFFILRKQEEKATYFHICHHIAMVLMAWTFERFFAGGHGSLTGLLICLSRVWLFAYYILLYLCPQWINPIWFRRRYNEILMVFSLIVLLHSLPVLFLEDCGFPKFPIVIICITTSAFLVFFCKFYASTYLKKKKA